MANQIFDTLITSFGPYHPMPHRIEFTCAHNAEVGHMEAFKSYSYVRKLRRTCQTVLSRSIRTLSHDRK